MLTQVTHPAQIPEFTKACAYERVFGSKALTALKAYGLESPRARFYLCVEGNEPSAALYLDGGVLAVSARAGAEAEPLAQLVRAEKIGEVDTNWQQCAALQALLGGWTESSYYMVYKGGMPAQEFPGIVPGELPAVFDVLQRSHEYYRTHLAYESWAADWERKITKGLAELYQLELNGEVIGTGAVGSQDDECGVIAAVAVVPEHRNLGLGSTISRFLVKRIMEKGKTPRLISGYDEVAELYRKIGFETCGRWGELYLP